MKQKSAEYMNDELVAKDPRKIFVVYGRNEKARRALYAFLRALHLHPIEWTGWLAQEGEGSPYVGNILQRGFTEAQGFVILMTPDDEARLRESLRGSDDGPHEGTLTGQARPNMLFEAGMAMGFDSRKTVLVQLGKLRPISDLAGRHVVKLDNSFARRHELALKLSNVGCPVDMTGTDWLQAGDFDAALEGL